MVPGDIGAELAQIVRAAVAAGELPPEAVTVPAGGTWRPAPPGEGGGPGTYATSLPIMLARGAGQDATSVAAQLAAALEPVPWIANARGSGQGYLTVTVTARHLAALPARIVAAAQRPVPAAPPVPDPAAAPDWALAWRAQRDAVLVRLEADKDLAAELHGHASRAPSPDSSRRDLPSDAADPGAGDPAAAGPAEERATGRGTLAAGPGPVASAVAWHGTDAVRYALARTAGPRSAAIERQLALPLDLDNPFVLVRYAHGHAASTARWAADLARAAGYGVGSDGVGAGAAGQQPGSVAGAGGPMYPELALLSTLSWSGERVAAAARRRRPAELCAYLERLAADYLECARTCPALPPGGAAAPPDPAGPQAGARLELAAAAEAVLAAGLRLVGVSGPDELFEI